MFLIQKKGSRLFPIKQSHFFPLLLLFVLGGNVACTSLPFHQEKKAHYRIFLTDFSTAWEASKKAASEGSIVIIPNREAGTIKFRGWKENTEKHNFLESFSGENYHRQSRYRLFIRIHEGKKNGKQAVMVQIQKEQQAEKSIFAHWEGVPSSGVDEATYLYRIGKLIAIQEHEEKIDEEKSKNFSLE